MPTGSLTFIGTATTLIRCAGFTVLTDPNFLHRGERASLGYGLTSERLRDPAMEMDALPPLDAVVLSHLHGDHFDRVARHGLAKELPVVTTRSAARVLKTWGFARACPMRTWDRWSARNAEGGQLRVTSLPARHAFGLLGLLLPPVMGSLLEFREEPGGPAYRVYITGDTLVFDGLREIAERHPDIDLGLIHLGGTKVLGATVTMDGRRGVDLLETVPVPTVVPIHYDDYAVMKSPLSDFTAEVARRSPPARIAYIDRGEELPLP